MFYSVVASQRHAGKSVTFVEVYEYIYISLVPYTINFSKVLVNVNVYYISTQIGI